MKFIIVSALFALAAFGQTAPDTSVAVPAVEFPQTPLPIEVAAFAEYNQLGSPRWTLGLAAIYPVVGSVGVYGTTTTDVLPKKATDPKTGRSFYALSTSVRQGFHKDIFDTGRLSVLVGGDVGPSFGNGDPSGISINFSSSFVATGVFQITPAVSVIVPIRMLYVSGIGWNPIAEAGVALNLKNMPKKK